MMESGPQPYEENSNHPSIAGMSIESVPSAGGSPSEITAPASGDEAPDPYYGDYTGSGVSAIQSSDVLALPGPSSDIVPAYANYFPEVKAPYVPPARTQPRLLSPDSTQGIRCRLVIDGTEKHVRRLDIPTPRNEAEEVEAMRLYMEGLRNQGTYPSELRMNGQERAILARYTDAQRRVAAHLRVLSNVEYDLASTPWHVLPDKAAVDGIITHEMSHTWLTPTGGAYTPITGALWPRYVDTQRAAQQALPSPERRQLGRRASRDIVARSTSLPVPLQGQQAPPIDAERAHRGIARLIAESSATFIGVPRDIQGGIRRGGELCVVWGIGYKRPDLGTTNNDGLHRAVTEMATSRLLREGKYDGPTRWQNFGVNAILDGVIRGVANRRHEHPQDVADGLLAGYYNGDLQPLGAVFETLPATAHVLPRLKGVERDNEIGYISSKLDLPGIVRTYQALKAGTDTTLYKY